MVVKKKTQQKQFKDIVVASEYTEPKKQTSMLFNFKSKFGNIIFSSPMLDCDVDTMQKLVAEYKRVHDLKDLSLVAVAPFIKWAIEDRGFKLTRDEVVDILWS